MRSKEVVSNKLDQLRNNIKLIKYLMNTNGTFTEILAAFDSSFDTLDIIDNLVNIEPDAFGNKIV